MNGYKPMPTSTLTKSADQLDPTFVRICLFSTLSIGIGSWPRADCLFLVRKSRGRNDICSDRLKSEDHGNHAGDVRPFRTRNRGRVLSHLGRQDLEARILSSS